MLLAQGKVYVNKVSLFFTTARFPPLSPLPPLPASCLHCFVHHLRHVRKNTWAKGLFFLLFTLKVSAQHFLRTRSLLLQRLWSGTWFVESTLAALAPVVQKFAAPVSVFEYVALDPAVHAALEAVFAEPAPPCSRAGGREPCCCPAVSAAPALVMALFRFKKKLTMTTKMKMERDEHED